MPEQTISGNLSAVVPIELVEEVEKIADEQRWTVSFTTRVLIEEALAARAKKAKKQ
jgi:hypothetical protein